SASKSWSSPTYRAVARYDLSRDANVYVSVSNGFKSGVFDAYSANPVPVDPEKVNAIEIGTKARVNDITLAAAAYAYDYTDIQVASFATVGGAIVQSLSNAAEATMRGLEFSAEGPVSDHLSFSAGLNWLPTARFDTFETASVTVPIPGASAPPFGQVVAPYDVSGSRVPRTPDWTVNLRLTYAAPLWNGDFSGTVSAFYSPGFYWQPGNLTEEEAYDIVNFRLAWTDAAGRFTYSVWGTDITDSAYSFFTAPNALGDSISIAQGRQLGVGFAMRF